MGRRHWFIETRNQLLAKLLFRSLSGNAAHIAISGSDSLYQAIDTKWRLNTTALKGSGKLSGHNRKGKERFDAILCDSIGAAALKPGELFDQLSNDAILLFHLSGAERKMAPDLASELESVGFAVEQIFYQGFFARLLTLPLRLIGVGINPERPPLAPLNWLLATIGRLENRALPYVRFISGEASILLARRLQPPAATQCELSVVIPAWNEEGRILPFLKSIESYLSEAIRKKEISSYEVVVVDDGSSDRTAEICEGAIDSIRVVRLWRNFGKGGAVREGVRLAHGELILISDADGATPIDEFASLHEWLQCGRDIAIGSRYLAESQIIIEQPPLRRLISRSGNLLIRTLTGLPFRDTQCGFKLFHRIPAKVLFRDLRNQRFGFDFEILKYAVHHNFSVAEVAVEWHDQSGSSVTGWETLHVLRELISLQFGYFFRFALVGVANTVVDYSIHNSLILIWGMGDLARQTLYQVIAFIFANLISFVFNSGFTFQARGSYWKFFLISGVTLTLSTLAFYGLNSLFNPENELLLTNLLKLSTVAVSFVTNYFGYRLLVFRR